jgi:hypothetical protein
MIDPDRNAKTLGSIYLVMYFLGSIVAIVGQVIEPLK